MLRNKMSFTLFGISFTLPPCFAIPHVIEWQIVCGIIHVRLNKLRNEGIILIYVLVVSEV